MIRNIDDLHLVLTPGEKMSSVWRKLEEHLIKLREVYLIRLEQPQPEDQTALLRGRLAMIRSVLTVAETPEPMFDSDNDAGTEGRPARRRQ